MWLNKFSGYADMIKAEETHPIYIFKPKNHNMHIFKRDDKQAKSCVLISGNYKLTHS